MNTIEQFKADVDQGLSANPKFLSSKYFYDKKGDALFQQIMHLHEYYLTRCELEIFKCQTEAIIDSFDIDPSTYFELIELGAGDGLKTKELIKVLLNQNYHFDYIPIDISPNALSNLKKSLKKTFPALSIKPRQGEYFSVLASLKNITHPKVVLFLGSNLGNMLDATASDFIYKLGTNLQLNDKLLLGLDLIKSEEIVLPAYNDNQGITKAFNLNLLTRINRELGADFDTSTFEHCPYYTEKEGVARSFLKSLKEQEVHVRALNKNIVFRKGEKIFMEISRKYNDSIVEKIVQPTDFILVKKLTDSKQYFADYILNRSV